MSGTETEFEEIYKKYYPSVYRICGSMFSKPDMRDDVVQEVFIKVWQNLKFFKNQSSLFTWIYRITINTSLNYKSRVVANKTTGYESVVHLPVENNNLEDERKRQLQNCIGKLRDDERIIVSLYLEGFSYNEISEIVGITVTNIGVKLNRIKPKLKICMED
ncbi:MAG TPA: RNA polymerase sigma factor [Chitinophagaceae bacterium]|nr:RNA polymerase sigma factor [Chitinophagaceae bacterium]